jgi:hypothetical protein
MFNDLSCEIKLHRVHGFSCHLLLFSALLFVIKYYYAVYRYWIWGLC